MTQVARVETEAKLGELRARHAALVERQQSISRERGRLERERTKVLVSSGAAAVDLRAKAAESRALEDEALCLVPALEQLEAEIHELEAAHLRRAREEQHAAAQVAFDAATVAKREARAAMRRFLTGVVAEHGRQLAKLDAAEQRGREAAVSLDHAARDAGVPSSSAWQEGFHFDTVPERSLSDMIAQLGQAHVFRHLD